MSAANDPAMWDRLFVHNQRDIFTHVSTINDKVDAVHDIILKYRAKVALRPVAEADEVHRGASVDASEAEGKEDTAAEGSPSNAVDDAERVLSVPSVKKISEHPAPQLLASAFAEHPGLDPIRQSIPMSDIGPLLKSVRIAYSEPELLMIRQHIGKFTAGLPSCTLDQLCRVFYDTRGSLAAINLKFWSVMSPGGAAAAEKRQASTRRSSQSPERSSREREVVVAAEDSPPDELDRTAEYESPPRTATQSNAKGDNGGATRQDPQPSQQRQKTTSTASATSSPRDQPLRSQCETSASQPKTRSRSASVQSQGAASASSQQNRRLPAQLVNLKAMHHDERTAYVQNFIRGTGEMIAERERQVWTEVQGPDGEPIARDRVSSEDSLRFQRAASTAVDACTQRMKDAEQLMRDYDRECEMLLLVNPTLEAESGVSKEVIAADREELHKESKLLSSALYEMKCNVYELLWLSSK